MGERIGEWAGPDMVALLCVAARRAIRPTGEWGCRARRHMYNNMLEPAPRGGVTRQGVVLTDLQSSI